MTTKRQRLHETAKLSRMNNHAPPTHNQNEGNWTVIAVEPILAALEWQRVAPAKRLKPGVDGAAYEWPNNHKIDVVLFAGGHALALMENKDTLANARKDLLHAGLRRKVGEKHRARLDPCAWGLYSWHKEGGGFGWIPYTDGNLDLKHDCTLNLRDIRSVGDADRLAQLARPVLTGAVMQDAWLAASVDQGDAIKPRFDLFAVQRAFFELLVREVESRYGADIVPNLQCREVADGRPTPTKAYVDLPDVVLPNGWGLAYSLQPLVDEIKCLFYRGSRRHDGEPVCMDYPDGIPERSLVQGFVQSKVLPRIEEHRKSAGLG